MTEEVLLDATKIVKRFGGVAALSGVDLKVGRGAVHAIIGPNGSGKTTLLNILSGADRPDSGSVRLEGMEVVGLRRNRIVGCGLARTFQNIKLFGALSALDNVKVAAQRHKPVTVLDILVRSRSYRDAERETKERAFEALDIVGLRGRADDFATALPYAQQRLLEIARAVASSPKILLLDEPAAGMNMTEALSLLEVVELLRRRIGMTIVLVEHNVRLVMGISDRVSVLDFGKKIAEGPPNDIQRDPAVIAAYLGRRRAHA